MKKTMTREDFNKLFGITGNNFCYYNGKDFYDTLSKAGISFDIYTDSEGQIIKQGDECEFWDDDKREYCKENFLGFMSSSQFPFASNGGSYKNCRKLPTEVWEPVPVEDIVFLQDGGYYVDTGLESNWKKCRITNGKLEGVRK